MDTSATGLAILADHLKDPMFDSRAVVDIDSIIVVSLFGQRVKKKEKRRHQVQTLSIAPTVDQMTKDAIYNIFEENKKDLHFSDPKSYIHRTNRMAASLYRGCSPLKEHGGDSRAIVEWCACVAPLIFIL